MSEQQMRKAFETTFSKLSPGCDFSRYNNGLNYSNPHVEHTWEGWQAALSQPAPQGVAEVMALVDQYASDNADFVLVGSTVSSRYPVEQAITAIVQERDALKAREAELEGDVARDAARYRWLTADLTGAAKYLRDELLDRMSVMSYSSACTDIDAAIDASKEAT